MKTFKHSGDLGDIIFSLPTVRALGGGILYLDPLGGLNNPLVKWADKKQTKLTETAIKSLIPVLEQQDYIKGVELWEGQSVNYDLDLFRKNIKYNNLSDSHLAAFNLPFTERDPAWLNIKHPRKIHKPTIISRSVRYHGNYSFWETNLSLLKDQSVFVGLEKEHEIFEYTFNHKVEYYKTPTILDLAEVLAGAELFVGNQGLPHALAESMKVNLINEVYRVYPSAVFTRAGAQYV
jgi:hypothetical protein